MTQKLILTTTVLAGKDLKRRILKFNSDFQNVESVCSKDLMKRVGDFDSVEYIFSTWNMPILRVDEIEALFPTLKSIFYAGGSTEYFASPYKYLGVQVNSYEHINAIPVAEFILGALILGNKGYIQTLRRYRPYLWIFDYLKARKIWTESNGNFNKVVGIIGCGNVGLALVNKLKCLEVSILIHDPFMDRSKLNEAPVSFVSLEHLFSQSDVITNHLPDVESTKEILSKKLFKLMKSQVVFINTGRASQIVKKDFLRAMKIRPKAVAFIDVTKKEPTFPWDPYFWMSNVYLSPHIAGSSNNELDRIIINILRDFQLAPRDNAENE